MKTTLAAWMRNGPLEADRPQGIPGGDEKEETRQHRIFRAIYLIVRTPSKGIEYAPSRNRRSPDDAYAGWIRDGVRQPGGPGWRGLDGAGAGCSSVVCSRNRHQRLVDPPQQQAVLARFGGPSASLASAEARALTVRSRRSRHGLGISCVAAPARFFCHKICVEATTSIEAILNPRGRTGPLGADRG